MEEVAGEFDGAGGDMRKAGAVDEHFDHLEGAVHIAEMAAGQEIFPGGFVGGEVAGERGRRGGFANAEGFFVEAADQAGVAAAGGLEGGQGFESHEAGEAFAGLAGGGNGVGLGAGFHLEAVLEVAQKEVGGGEGFDVLGAEEAVGGEFFQGWDGGGGLEKGHVAGVEELERLDDELNFADATAAEFDVALQFAGLDDFVFDAGFHGGDIAQDAGGDGTGITKGLDHFQEFGAQFGVAGDGTGFDQHHAFPGLAPMRVVSLEAVEGTDQGAGGAFGAEAEVNSVKRAFGSQAADFGDDAFGQAGEEEVAGDVFSGLFAGTRGCFEVTAFLALKENDVHVGTVVEFLAAEFAEAEDAEFGGQPATVGGGMEGLTQAAREGLEAKAEDGVEAGIGDVGDFAGDFEGGAEAGEVAGGDAEHFALFELAEFGERGLQVVAVEGGFEPALDFAAEALLSAGMVKEARFQQRGEPFGMGGEQVSGHLGAGKEGGEDAGLFGGRVAGDGGGGGLAQACQGGGGPGGVGAGGNGFGEGLRLD